MPINIANRLAQKYHRSVFVSSFPSAWLYIHSAKTPGIFDVPVFTLAYAAASGTARLRAFAIRIEGAVLGESRGENRGCTALDKHRNNMIMLVNRLANRFAGFAIEACYYEKVRCIFQANSR